MSDGETVVFIIGAIIFSIAFGYFMGGATFGWMAAGGILVGGAVLSMICRTIRRE